ncbi:MAG TPA: hypothetical protein VEK10_03545 [Steroidobacteraceae bacterium]|nr:hypothetical protein [Steroidobacteraceae bacterium]
MPAVAERLLLIVSDSQAYAESPMYVTTTKLYKVAGLRPFAFPFAREMSS